MKSIILSFVSILLTIFFTGCSDDFGTSSKSVPSAVKTSSVEVKIDAIASPYLKDGDEENNPDLMFEITGVVIQNGNPVQAELELVSMPQSTLVDSTNTDSNGGFGFYQVASGSYNVVVYVEGNVADVIVVNL